MNQRQKKLVPAAGLLLLLLFLFPPMIYEDPAYSVQQSIGHRFLFTDSSPKSAEDVAETFGASLIENGLVRPERTRIRISWLRMITETLLLLSTITCIYIWLGHHPLKYGLSAVNLVITLTLCVVWFLLASLRF